jgi:hypothetical protein
MEVTELGIGLVAPASFEKNASSCNLEGQLALASFSSSDNEQNFTF